MDENEEEVEQQNFEVSTSVIKPEHVSLKEEFIRRTTHLLSQKQEIKSYGVSESYGTEVEEAEITVNGYTIRIRVSKQT